MVPAQTATVAGTTQASAEIQIDPVLLQTAQNIVRRLGEAYDPPEALGKPAGAVRKSYGLVSFQTFKSHGARGDKGEGVIDKLIQTLADGIAEQVSEAIYRQYVSPTSQEFFALGASYVSILFRVTVREGT